MAGHGIVAERENSIRYSVNRHAGGGWTLNHSIGWGMEN